MADRTRDTRREKLDHVATVRFTERQWREVQECADQKGITVSQLIRRRLRSGKPQAISAYPPTVQLLDVGADNEPRWVTVWDEPRGPHGQSSGLHRCCEDGHGTVAGAATHGAVRLTQSLTNRFEQFASMKDTHAYELRQKGLA